MAARLPGDVNLILTLAFIFAVVAATAQLGYRALVWLGYLG